jgi:NAD(P)-dependent dehydrogenase (short-subunit alcohol dehydrogenase family)
MRNKPKTILITGASSGIGEATAKFFIEKGWNVSASMRDPSRARPWTRAKNVITPAIDVTDQAACVRGAQQTIQHFGKIDVLFNNAGYGLNGPIEGATEEQMHRQFDVNLFGVVRMTNAVLPHMRRRRQGLILTTSSIGGLIGMPVAPLYISSKHAVEGLIESTRFELKPFGIRMKLIEPGGINTDFSRRSAVWTSHPDYLGYIEGAKAMSNSILEGMPKPEEVAKVVYRAANDSSERLRYLARPGMYITLYNLLPDWIWRRMIQGALRSAGRSGARQSTPAVSVKQAAGAVR